MARSSQKVKQTKNKSGRKSATKTISKGKSGRKSSDKKNCTKGFVAKKINTPDIKGTVCVKKQKKVESDSDSDYSYSDYSSSSSYSSSSDSDSDYEFGSFASNANDRYMGTIHGEIDEKDGFKTLGDSIKNLKHAKCHDLPKPGVGDLKERWINNNSTLCSFDDTKQRWNIKNPKSDEECNINFKGDGKKYKLVNVPTRMTYKRIDADGTLKPHTVEQGPQCVSEADTIMLNNAIKKLNKASNKVNISMERYEDLQKNVAETLAKIYHEESEYHKDASGYENTIKVQSEKLLKKRRAIKLLQDQHAELEKKLREASSYYTRKNLDEYEENLSDVETYNKAVSYLTNKNKSSFSSLEEIGRKQMRKDIRDKCETTNEKFKDNASVCLPEVTIPWLLKISKNECSEMKGLSLCSKINKIMSIVPEFRFLSKGLPHEKVCGDDADSPQQRAIQLVVDAGLEIERSRNDNENKYTAEQFRDIQMLGASIDYKSKDCHKCDEYETARSRVAEGRSFSASMPPKMSVRNHIRDSKYYF